MFKDRALILHPAGAEHLVRWDDVSTAVLTARYVHTLQHPKQLPLGAMTIIARARGADVLHAATARDKVMTHSISST